MKLMSRAKFMLEPVTPKLLEEKSGFVFFSVHVNCLTVLFIACTVSPNEKSFFSFRTC